MSCILKLFLGVGLEVLRKLFMEINPKWSNNPSDADSFDKGILEFYNENEKEAFYRGDINKWDFSLISSVLLYSNGCARGIRRRRDRKGALRVLRNIRNKLLGHNYTDRLSDDYFSHYWSLLSRSFITLGADPQKIQELRLNAGNYALTFISSLIPL